MLGQLLDFVESSELMVMQCMFCMKGVLIAWSALLLLLWNLSRIPEMGDDNNNPSAPGLFYLLLWNLLQIPEMGDDGNNGLVICQQ